MTSYNALEPLLTPSAVLEACRLGRIRAGDLVTVAIGHPELTAPAAVEHLERELGWYGVSLVREDKAGEEFRVERGRAKAGTRRANATA